MKHTERLGLAAVIVLPLLVVSSWLAGSELLLDSPGKVTERQAGFEASKEALAQRFLDALALDDRNGAARLAVTREEFYRDIWPHLPAARPGTNYTADYVWKQTSMRSMSGFAKTMNRYGGRRFELVRVEIAEGRRDYGPFFIHKDARLVVRDPGGKEQRLDLFGSILEKDGCYKIYSFVNN